MIMSYGFKLEIAQYFGYTNLVWSDNATESPESDGIIVEPK